MKASQKKVLGWFLLVPLSLVFIALIGSMLYMTFSSSENREWKDSLLGLLFTTVLMTFALRYTYKLIKSAKARSAQPVANDSTFRPISLAVTIDLKSYFYLLLHISYRHLGIQFMSFIGLVMFIGIIVRSGEGEVFLMAYLFSAFTFLLPFIIYFNAKKNYKINKQLQYRTLYTFSEEGITIDSEVAQGHTSWSTIHKVLELKRWFILYTASNVGYLLPKEAFANPEEINLFRTLLEARTERAAA